MGVSAGATVVPLKILDFNGSGTWSSLTLAFDHIAYLYIPGDVVNLSLGALYDHNNCASINSGLFGAVKRLAAKGVHIVMASGNSGVEASFNFPGCIDGANIYTVGSVTGSLECAGYSNFGKPPVDWVAVGTAVLSPFIKNASGSWQYKLMSGTSMSTAVISGVIHANNGPPTDGPVVRCRDIDYKVGKVFSPAGDSASSAGELPD
jgi:subtilisin family serine protease